MGCWVAGPALGARDLSGFCGFVAPLPARLDAIGPIICVLTCATGDAAAFASCVEKLGAFGAEAFEAS